MGSDTAIWIKTPDTYFDDDWTEHDSEEYFRDKLPDKNLIFLPYSSTFYITVDPETRFIKAW